MPVVIPISIKCIPQGDFYKSIPVVIVHQVCSTNTILRRNRFIVAKDSSWLSQGIIRYYALLWLVEAFIEDWKQHYGWGKLDYQQAEDGARRGLLLSLLLDHSLFFHAQQTAQIKHNFPAFTVGSLRSAINNESLISTITQIVNDDEPIKALDSFKTQLQQSQTYNFSTKHLSGRRMEKFPNKDQFASDSLLAA